MPKRLIVRRMGLGDLRKDRFDAPLKCREVALYRCSDFLGINTKIVMDKDMAHGHDLSLWDLGMYDLEGVRDAASSLSD